MERLNFSMTRGCRALQWKISLEVTPLRTVVGSYDACSWLFENKIFTIKRGQFLDLAVAEVSATTQNLLASQTHSD
jgi:hypothetical protein